MFHFPLRREYVTGMPGIEIKFPSDILVCFRTSLAPYVILITRIYLQDIARPDEKERFINTMFVRPSFRSQLVNVGS